LKVLEAMAGGVPVVTTDLPVVRHLGIDRQHFLLTRPNSVEDMVAKIQELDRDPHLRHQLSIHARQHILDNFTWQKAGTALQQAYAQW
jgi:glycosyltransferase involved in cell wall biosynthesis